MVTTRSRVKQAEAAAVVPDPPAPTSTKQRKRKSSTSLSSSSLSPVPKLAKTDLALEEFPRAPAPTPVAQPQQPPLAEAVAQPVDVTEAATAAAKDLTAADPFADTNVNAMDVTPTQVPAPVVASGVAPMAGESALHGDVVMTKADTEPSLKAPLTALATMPATLTNIKVPSTMTTTADISALESVKEPVPESWPLPEVATVLTQPALATMTSATPMTAVEFNSNTTTDIPPAPTAPQLSTISAPAPTPGLASALAPAPAPAAVPILSSGSTVPLADTTILSSGLAPVTASTSAPMNNAAAIAFSTDKPLPETALETPLMTNLIAVDPTSLLLAPGAELPDGSSAMTAVTAAPMPASVVMLPAMTTTTGGRLQPQFQVPGAKDVDGTTTDIGVMTNDFQPQAMPQQQVNRPGKVSSVVGVIDATNSAAAGVGSNAKGPNQSGV